MNSGREAPLCRFTSKPHLTEPVSSPPARLFSAERLFGPLVKVSGVRRDLRLARAALSHTDAAVPPTERVERQDKSRAVQRWRRTMGRFEAGGEAQWLHQHVVLKACFVTGHRLKTLRGFSCVTLASFLWVKTFLHILNTGGEPMLSASLKVRQESLHLGCVGDNR